MAGPYDGAKSVSSSIHDRTHMLYLTGTEICLFEKLVVIIVCGDFGSQWVANKSHLLD